MTLQELEQSIALLPPEQLAEFRDWFFRFDAQVWDEKIESDIAAGRLEALAEEAINDHRAGKTTGL